jgi:hypothetical protein
VWLRSAVVDVLNARKEAYNYLNPTTHRQKGESISFG